MEYRSPRVCATCWQPWFGIGPICNDCVQTQALSNLDTKSKFTGTPVYTSTDILVEGGAFWVWTVALIAFGIAYACHWELARMFVNIIKFILWMPMGLMLGWHPDFSM